MQPKQSVRKRLRERLGRRRDVLYVVVVGLLIVVGVVVATIGNEGRVQDWDPQYFRNLAERVSAFGGTYYENGILNKGPLLGMVYGLAGRITTFAGYWYAISAMVALLSLALSYAAARTVRFIGGSREVAAAAGAAIFVHFTFSGSVYGGVLYARNLNAAILAVIWVLIIDDRWWATRRRRQITSGVIGGLAGLAVQTVFSAALTGGALMVLFLAHLRGRVTKREDPLSLIGIAILAGTAVFMSPMLWYSVRGSFAEFWGGWWIDAQAQIAGLQRSLVSQIALAWDQFYSYYQVRPMLFFLIAIFGAITIAGWRTNGVRWRLFHSGLLGWWLAGWAELLISQRYSTHYFIVIAAPTALMAAALAGHAYRVFLARRTVPSVTVSPNWSTVTLGKPMRWMIAWPVLVALLAVYLSGPRFFFNGLHDTLEFRGAAAHLQSVEDNYEGWGRTTWAVLDLVSEDGDPLLAWTNQPWPYLKWKRVSATRFIWKAFLMGEIYLGATNPGYAAAQTWNWFAEDLEESQPVLFADVDKNLAEGTPFALYVEQNFRPVYPGSVTPVSFRNDVATDVLEPSAETPWSISDPPGPSSGWTVEGSTARFSDSGLERPLDLLPLSDDACFRLEGTISNDGSEPAAVAFRFDDTLGQAPRFYLTFAGDRVISGADAVVFEELPSDIIDAGPVPFSLVVGHRAAALVVNGQIRAAVRLPDSVSVHAEAQTGSLVLSDLRLGNPPATSGCS